MSTKREEAKNNPKIILESAVTMDPPKTGFMGEVLPVTRYVITVHGYRTLASAIAFMWTMVGILLVVVTHLTLHFIIQLYESVFH